MLLHEEEKKNNYKNYVKVHVNGNMKKHPVILTKEEKEKIDQADKKSNDKSYDESITYDGHTYICPRYWCFLR